MEGRVPHYVRLEAVNETGQRKVCMFRFVEYDNDFTQKCARVVYAREEVMGLFAIGSNGERLPLEKPELQPGVIIIGLDMKDRSLRLKPGGNSISLLADADLSAEELTEWVNRVIHAALNEEIPAAEAEPEEVPEAVETAEEELNPEQQEQTGEPEAPVSAEEVIYEVPALIPEEPVQVPEEPVQIPEEPVQIPEEPVQVPEEPVQIPEEPVQVPEEPVQVPEEPVRIPEEPVQIPEMPVWVTEGPVQIPEMPAWIAEEPVRVPEATDGFHGMPIQEFPDPQPVAEEKPKKKGKKKRGILVLIIVLVVLAAAAVLGVFALWTSNYSAGQEAEAQGNHAEALKHYRVSSGYKDSAALADKIDAYIKGTEFFEEGSYEAAHEQFLLAQDYFDAAAQAEECVKMLHYEAGNVALAEENYVLAVEEFTLAGDCLDAADLVLTYTPAMHYQLGCEALEAGDYALAEEELTAAGSWKGAKSQLKYAQKGLKFQDAQELMESGKYKDAYKTFASISDFPGAMDKKTECAYRIGLDALNKGEYADACKYLEECGKYQDAPAKLGEASFKYAKVLLAQGKYSDANKRFSAAKTAGYQHGDLANYILLTQAENLLATDSLKKGIEAYKKLPTSFRPEEMDVSARIAALDKLGAFAALEGTYGSTKYNIQIFTTYTYYYPSGVLKDQELTISCLLEADGQVTITGKAIFYYFNGDPTLWSYRDQKNTVNFTIRNLDRIPNMHTIDDTTKIYLSGDPRIYYSAKTDGGRSTISDVTYNQRK